MVSQQGLYPSSRTSCCKFLGHSALVSLVGNLLLLASSPDWHDHHYHEEPDHEVNDENEDDYQDNKVNDEDY